MSDFDNNGSEFSDDEVLLHCSRRIEEIREEKKNLSTEEREILQKVKGLGYNPSIFKRALSFKDTSDEEIESQSGELSKVVSIIKGKF